MDDLSFKLYKKLYLTRRAEEFIIKYYSEDEMKTPMHMSMGQEAISVGVCHALGSEDQILTSYRSHASFLAKTGDTDIFFAELYGKESGTAQGKAGSMHLSDHARGHLGSSGIVATGIPIAAGVAYANKMKGNGQICCVFFGDGAPDEGAFWESLNVACLMQLPVIFICEDNGFAVHTSKQSRQGYKSITDVVSNFECNVFKDDTTDVEQIHRLTLDAIESINKTHKPAFVHLKCYRYLEHVGIHEDFDAGYRSKSVFMEWYKRDCVTTQRRRLIDDGHAETEVKLAEQQIDEQIKSSITRAKAAPFPKLEDLYKGVFYEEN